MNKIILFLPFLVILMVGCAQQSGESSNVEIPEETEWRGEFEIIGQGEDIDDSSRGFIRVSELRATGEFTFKTVLNGNSKEIRGSGTGESSILVIATPNKKGESILECRDEDAVEFTFEVSGNWDETTEGFSPVIVFDSFSPSTFRDAGVGTCTSQTGHVGSGIAEVQYKHVLGKSYFPGQRLSMMPRAGTFVETSDSCGYHEFCGKLTNTITITKLTPSDFYFDVDVDPPIITINQGETAKAMVSVNLLRGMPQPVKLTATEWSPFKAWFDKSPLNVGESTILNIESNCNTPPGNYLYTAQGEVGFRSSVDSVSVKVINYPGCKS